MESFADYMSRPDLAQTLPLSSSSHGCGISMTMYWQIIAYGFNKYLNSIALNLNESINEQKISDMRFCF